MQNGAAQRRTQGEPEEKMSAPFQGVGKQKYPKDGLKQELTPYALRELVKAIYIGAPDKSSGKRRQEIRISYDLVGFIPLNELMKQETA